MNLISSEWKLKDLINNLNAVNRAVNNVNVNRVSGPDGIRTDLEAVVVHVRALAKLFNFVANETPTSC